MLHYVRGERESGVPFQPASYRFTSEHGRKSERSFDCLHEISFFTKDKPLALCHGEILTRLGIRPQARPVSFVSRKTSEGDQAPGNIIRAFVRKEIPDEMASAARNDVPPVFCVLFERVSLERIDLVADDASDCHFVLHFECMCLICQL